MKDRIKTTPRAPGSAGANGAGGVRARGERVGLGDAEFERVVGDLVRSIRDEGLTRLRAATGTGAGGGFRAADLAGVRELVEVLRRLVFPGYFDAEPPGDAGLETHVAALARKGAAILDEEVRAVLRYRQEGIKVSRQQGVEGVRGHEGGDAFVERVVREFFENLARVREALALDVQAAYDGDPAAEHTDEVVLCYPGLDAIFTHRIAHELYRLGVPILPRVIAEQAHSRTGIDIHPGARIGERFFIDHGSATVIGETSVIGKQVKIYQGVTLGARSFPKDERGRAIKGLKRHPTIGDRVTIYAGAVILGGDTVIGDDCVIAGGVFVTSSVPPGHVVQQVRQEPVLKPHGGAGPAKEKKATGQVDLNWLDAGSGI